MISRLRCNITRNQSSRAISFWKRKSGDADKDSGQLETLETRDEVTEGTRRESVWSHLNREQILRIRYKGRLPRDVLCELKGIPEHGNRLTHINHYRRDWIRKYFATYGRASGLKPGLCWPSKEELMLRNKFEETFCPPLQQMLDESRRERHEREQEVIKYRQNIMTNLRKLPEAKKAFYAQLRAKKELEEEEKKKRERVVQEVREYLGYDVAPGDTRFQEALLKKEEEEQVVKKASKKQEKQAKIMAQLAAMAQEQVNKAEADQSSGGGGGGVSQGETTEDWTKKAGDKLKKPETSKVEGKSTKT